MRAEMTADYPNRATSLLRGMSWSVLGHGVSALSQWGILVVLIKHLSPTDVGQFALALAVIGPLFALTNLQLAGLLASDPRQSTPREAYLVLRATMTGTAYVILAGMCGARLLKQDLWLPVMLLGLVKVCEAASDLVYGFLQQRERIDQVGMLQCVRGAATLAAVWIGVSLAPQMFAALMSLLLCQLALTLCVDWRALRQARDAFRPRVLWPLPHGTREAVHGLWQTALPMGLVVGMNLLTINIPRYWVAGTLGDAAVGAFAALSYVMTAGNMLTSAVGQAAVPRLASLHQNDSPAFKRLYLRLMGVAALIGMVGIAGALVAGRPLLALLYAPSYGEYEGVFLWIMIAAAVLYLVAMSGCVLTAARAFRAQAWATLGSTICTALACHVLIPRHGLVGAAMALGVGFAVKLAGQGMAWVLLAARR